MSQEVASQAGRPPRPDRCPCGRRAEEVSTIPVTANRRTPHPCWDKVYRQNTGMVLPGRKLGYQAAAHTVGAPVALHPHFPATMFGSLSTVLVPARPQPISFWSYTQDAPSPAWGWPLTWNPLPRSLSYGRRQPAILSKLFTSVTRLPLCKSGTVAASASWWS